MLCKRLEFTNLDRGYGPKSRNVFVGRFLSCGGTRLSKSGKAEFGSWLQIKSRNALCGGTFLPGPREFRIDYAAVTE